MLRIEPTQLEYTKDEVSRFFTLQSLSERLEFVTLILGLEIKTMTVERGDQLEICFTDGTTLIAKPAASYESWNVFMDGPGGGWWSCGMEI